MYNDKLKHTINYSKAKCFSDNNDVTYNSIHPCKIPLKVNHYLLETYSKHPEETKDTTATAQLKGVLPDFPQPDQNLSKGPSNATSKYLQIPYPPDISMPTVTVLIQAPHCNLCRLCPTELSCLLIYSIW